MKNETKRQKHKKEKEGKGQARQTQHGAHRENNQENKSEGKKNEKEENHDLPHIYRHCRDLQSPQFRRKSPIVSDRKEKQTFWMKPFLAEHRALTLFFLPL
ncbi:unnamed protein product [Boreogadus saida]